MHLQAASSLLLTLWRKHCVVSSLGINLHEIAPLLNFCSEGFSSCSLKTAMHSVAAANIHSHHQYFVCLCPSIVCCWIVEPLRVIVLLFFVRMTPWWVCVLLLSLILVNFCTWGRNHHAVSNVYTAVVPNKMCSLQCTNALVARQLLPLGMWSHCINNPCSSVAV